MIRFVLLVWFAVTAMPAWSGAWLRDKGTVFTSASVSIFKDPDHGSRLKSSLYAEWGARPNLTLGFDAEEHQDIYGHALVFARVPLANLGHRGLFAADLAVGLHHRQDRAWILYKGTLSYGKDFQSTWGAGWIAIDAALEYRSHDALLRKLDLTAGMSADRLLNPLLQIETAYAKDHRFYWTVRPSLMIRAKGRKTRWIIGIERNETNSGIGGRFGLWSEF